MRILVQKFGGSSVADLECMKKVRGKVREALAVPAWEELREGSFAVPGKSTALPEKRSPMPAMLPSRQHKMPMGSPQKPEGADIWRYEANWLPGQAKSPHHVMNQ